MTRMITLLMVFTITFCTAQQPVKTINKGTSETVEELKEALITLSEKLKSAQNNGALEEAIEKYVQAKEESNMRVLTKKIFTQNDTLSSNSSITYVFTFSGNEASQGIEGLEALDFQKLRKVFKKVSIALSESPEIKKLAESMRKLEEYQPAPKKD